jgi:hypothetical protein
LHNGFVSKEASVVAAGAVATDRKMFVVGGTNEELPRAAEPERDGEHWRFKGAGTEMTVKQKPRRR